MTVYPVKNEFAVWISLCFGAVEIPFSTTIVQGEMSGASDIPEELYHPRPVSG